MSQQHRPGNNSGEPQAPWYGGEESAQAPKTFPFASLEPDDGPQDAQAGTQGQPYGSQGQPYGSQGQPYASPNQPASFQGQGQGQPYEQQAQPYGRPAPEPQHGQQGYPQTQVNNQQTQSYKQQSDPYYGQPQHGSQGQSYGQAPSHPDQQQPESGGWHQQPGQPHSGQPQPGSQEQSYGVDRGAPRHARPADGRTAQGQQPFHGVLDPHTGEIHPVPDLENLQETDALLIVVSGPDAGAQILLDTDVVTVGRSPNADIFLDDVTVSRKHAEFVRTPSGFTLRDTGSLNGTYVGRQLIDSIELQNGADVQIGKFRMIFQQRPRSS
ncbi:hypothetical protein GCM10022261_27830 [Brevibacterium daeguense]|uniref:FHA domain-containing protein n=1 Tax=Brevibacterium daeguense TaxID=909936 RepID=A0ABP8EMP8_9MICO